MTHVVRAAGGVILRSVEDEHVEVLLVHRPKYDDWTLPKGKLLVGEDEHDAAVREVEEETGFRCEILGEIGATTYRDHNELPKTVRYFRMRRLAGHFAPNDEVDEVRWVPLSEIASLTTYPHDAELLTRSVRP